MLTNLRIRWASLRQSPGFNGNASLTVLILCMVAVHFSLLRVPYSGDECYFVAAARDLFLSGKIIPFSVPAESHPPLVYAWLSGWWTIFGFSIPVTRIAMLTIAALTLAATYRLASLFAKDAVAFAVTGLVALYPVFFSHSTMVQLDMLAAGLTLWALVFYLRGRIMVSGLLFSLAVLAKDTAIVAPLALMALYVALACYTRKNSGRVANRTAWRKQLPLLLPVLILSCWFIYLHMVTGTLFGDPEYVRDNLSSTLHLTRVGLVSVRNIWHLLGYMNLFVLTGSAAVICAMCSRRVTDRSREQDSCSWLVLASVIVAYLLMLAIVGEALLARYLLPVYPLVVLISLAAIERRVKWWPAVAGLTAAALIIGLFPYARHGFSREDNLAYLDYVELRQQAAAVLANDYKIQAKVITVWDSSQELAQPWLGYSNQPMAISDTDFTRQDLTKARQDMIRAGLDLPKYIVMSPPQACKPPHPFFSGHWWLGSYFDREQLTPDEVSQMMSARIIFFAQRRCDWIAVLKAAGANSASMPEQAKWR